uniref:RNA polymerase II C-terminal domain phosphatase-like n=1 Tax=Aegilops tauschii subsp. strangulata TaxID=200361 RepID=A0A453BXD5_AEGTS
MLKSRYVLHILDILVDFALGVGKDKTRKMFQGLLLVMSTRGLRLGTTEIDRLRGSDLKNLLREKKLILILDLDHTLINSTKLHDISAAENNLGIQIAASKDDPNGSLFTLEGMQMLTKLRPFVRKFLKEASNMFEMYIYTMGDKAYAIEIAKLLDPRNVYFNSKVISNSDCTQRHQKGLDMVLGAESVAVILDDTEYVWQKHKENLILMERYHYFASSCRQFGFSVKSLSELMQDERGSDGALATILDVLKRIHTIFFDLAVETALSSRDVRQGNQEGTAGSTARLQISLQSGVPVQFSPTGSVYLEDGRAAGSHLLRGRGFHDHPCCRCGCWNR